MTNEIETRNDNPNDLMRLAIEKGSDLSQLEKLLEISMKVDANKAKKAYVKAMAAFKSNPPKITKDNKVDFTSSKGRTNYNYANLATVTAKVNKSLSEYGLSASWTTHQNGKICVTCKITHDMGHSEETTLSADADMSGNKNSIQAIGSTVTYLQRYTLLALCGLATHDQDDDGVTGASEFITQEQAIEIDTLVNSVGVDAALVLKFANAESYNKILTKDYSRVIAGLEAKKEKK